jgi:hypothetical protein
MINLRKIEKIPNGIRRHCPY